MDISRSGVVRKAWWAPREDTSLSRGWSIPKPARSSIGMPPIGKSPLAAAFPINKPAKKTPLVSLAIVGPGLTGRMDIFA